MKWILALILCAFCAAPARAFPVERCVNLDNALNAPGYEGEWGYRIERAHLDRIARAGFDTVRLPVDFSTRWDGRRIDPAFLARTDRVIRDALDRRLRVILTFHGFDALRRDPGPESGKFLAIWTFLARHYRGWPEGLIFELYNEPAGALTTRRANALHASALAAIRPLHPTRWVVLDGGDWASVGALRRLKRHDSRTVRSFHYYEPWEFTHQGAEWLDAPPGETRWGSAADHARISRDIARAGRLAGPVFLGEFGVNHRVRPDLRWAWTETVRRAAEEAGIGWCHWGFATNFPLYDRRNGRWLDGALPALMERVLSSPEL